MRTECDGDHCERCITNGNCVACNSTAYHIASPAAGDCIGKDSFCSSK